MKSIGVKILVSSILVVFFSILLISIPVTLIQYKNSLNNAIESCESKVSNATSDLNWFLQEPVSIVSTTKSYLKTHSIEKDSVEPFLEDVLKGKISFLNFTLLQPFLVKTEDIFIPMTTGILLQIMTRQQEPGILQEAKRILMQFPIHTWTA